MSGPIADIAVPFRVAGSFHYLIPPELMDQVVVGSIVSVHFGRKRTHGFVLGVLPTSPLPIEKLRPIESVLTSEPLFDSSVLDFYRWASDYYVHPLGEVLSTALPKHAWKSFAKKQPKARKTTGSVPLAPKLEPERDMSRQLSAEQQQALGCILSTEETRPVLLHGVTGSGKTEVYIAAIRAILEQGKGAIVLVPEIALTPLVLGRFESHFPGNVAVLHSELTDRERRFEWGSIRNGERKIVIGARSAIFAPVKDLGIIVVDEEHESSFKQEDSFRYHARDLAVARAKWVGARVVLGSATPSLESYQNARTGKYALTELPFRILSRPLPKVEVIDLKNKELWVEPGRYLLTHPMIQAITETLGAGHQSILFLNKLGFAAFLICNDCGHTWRCSQCDVTLTYYKQTRSLKCHYCGTRHPAPSTCTECQSLEVAPIGFGTEQLEEWIRQYFPQARIARLDRDAVRNREGLEQTLSQFAAREIDILIGTQMLAKGHDFPGVALVGILMADSSLNFPDFRAAERTFQILTQVSGRAGRSNTPGKVLIQTFSPDHPAICLAATNQLKEFYEAELSQRRQFGFPPFARMAMLRFQGANESAVRTFSTQATQRVRSRADSPRAEKTMVLGPAEAPISRIKGLYRWQSLLRCESSRALHQTLSELGLWAEKVKSSVQFAIDVDPIQAL